MRRRVELDPQQPANVQTETHNAFGKPRLHAQDETLGPLPCSRLGAAVLVVTVHVVIAQGQVAVAVLDEARCMRMQGLDAEAEKRQEQPWINAGHTGNRRRCIGVDGVFWHVRYPFFIVVLDA
ncbi:hypothetical protein D3C84_751430 [compost metagenome]